MTQSLERVLEIVRRPIRSDTEDIRTWVVGIEGATAGKVLGVIVARVLASYAGLEEIDRLFRATAGNRRPNLEAAKRAEIVSGAFADYAALADSVLRSIANPPADRHPPADKVAELKCRRDAADELASVYRGEAQYFSGAPFTVWDRRRMVDELAAEGQRLDREYKRE